MSKNRRNYRYLVRLFESSLRTIPASRQPMRTGKTSEAEVAAYIEAMLEDGDARAVPVALRTVVDVVGDMSALADKAPLSREDAGR
jgi:DNA-binding phage protein